MLSCLPVVTYLSKLKRLSLGRLPVVTLSCCESLVKTVEIRGKNGRFASPVLFNSVGDKRSYCSGQYSSIANVDSQSEPIYNQRSARPLMTYGKVHKWRGRSGTYCTRPVLD
ncbi:hypothetical protein T10_516 [Trichinella papuae]|uniref:Uncharacterized protein n=1 Tax=Trichinella papuae TaxID=268474 RepID=A0A0V1N660_9BILA|nr:hypothetical protein T10_516 [Trichinella papuae]